MDRAVKNVVTLQAGNACEYCGLPQSCTTLRHQVDHIFAEKHDGKTVLGNLALTCMLCNLYKGTNISGIDPVTRKMVKLFHPRKNSWNAHFRWDGVVLEGKTAIARATIHVLRINHKKRLRHRELFYQAGMFTWK